MSGESAPLKVLDLFSGIGGFSLGLERTGGFQTAAFCEIDPFCRRVLDKHWPEVRQYHDVRELTAARLATDGIAVDVITGGFPCQDISTAGKQAGMGEETRSGLWSEIVRLAGDLRPRYLIVENVSNLLAGPSERPGGWFGRVLGDLAAFRYDAEWHCIPASAVGAPHIRNRVWVIAYPNNEGGRAQPIGKSERSCAPQFGHDGISQSVAHPAGNGRREGSPYRFSRDGIAGGDRTSEFGGSSSGKGPVAYADGVGRGQARRDDTGNPPEDRAGKRDRTGHGGSAIPNPNGQSARRLAISWEECGQWLIEPDVGRVANGVPSRVDRLRGLGNAVVPQIPEIIGKAILQAEGLTGGHLIR